MPQINAKKFYREKKQAKRVKMPAAGNFFFHIGTAIFNFSLKSFSRWKHYVFRD